MEDIKVIACITIVMFSFCTARSQTTLPDELHQTLSNEQKSFVATLSGASPISPGKTLNRRWTKTERQLARKYLQSRLYNIGIEVREQEYKVNLPHVKPARNPFRGTNLWAIVPASKESTEYIVIGAHYDSVSESPGAMDNATGCAVVYGVGKLIAQLPDRKRNLILVFFDQEETGHAGSYAFANYVTEKRLNIRSVHTFDMIGWDEDADRNIELELPAPELESLYRKLAQSFGITAYITETTMTDHREFRNAGFTAIGIGGEYIHGDSSPHHHAPTDTVDTVNFEYLAFVTVLVYRAIEELVQR